MPSNTSAKTAATKTQQSQPDIHPLFRKSQFLGYIEYDTVIQGAAILATRLLNTPQALHWAYAFLFGRNVDVEMPERAEGLPELINGPRKYACDKAIGQLSPEDLIDVREQLADLARRCHFLVKDDLDNASAIGETGASDINSEYAIITIRGSHYRRALLRSHYTQAQNALIDLDLAILMLHEVAHALNVYYMHNHEEDFFEGSLIAEHGFELESRIFGLVPYVPASTTDMTQRCSFYPWQTTKVFVGATHPELCRDESRLPKSSPHTLMDPKFAVKLCSDDSWEGEYLQKGAVALIMEVVQDLCREGRRDITTNAIPPSIRELFRETKGRNLKTYAERRYADFANPRRFFRRLAESDDEDSEDDDYGDETNKGANADTGVDWSEGDSADASGYNTEDMSDYSDDDATIRGSDDEMTEVEEWVSKPPAVKPPIVEKPPVKKPAVQVKNKVKTVEVEDVDLEAELREVQKADARRIMQKLREMREWEERKYAFFH